MAANDDFPRAQTLSADPGTNAQAVITFPASPGIEWVVEEIDWAAYATGETIAQSGNIIVITNQLTLEVGKFFVIATGGLQMNPGSWSGQIPGGVGNSLVVAFSGGISGGNEFITANAYPT